VRNSDSCVEQEVTVVRYRWTIICSTGKITWTSWRL